MKARTDGTLGEMMHYLSQYNFRIIYASGKTNIEADSLSRNPVLELFENDDDVLKVVNLIELQDIIKDQDGNRDMIRLCKNVLKKNNISYKNLKNRHHFATPGTVADRESARGIWTHWSSTHLSEG